MHRMTNITFRSGLYYCIRNRRNYACRLWSLWGNEQRNTSMDDSLSVRSMRHDSDITPKEVSSVKGSPYHLILSQFRRAFDCLAMRTTADEKLRKIMLIRSSRWIDSKRSRHKIMQQVTIDAKFNPRSPR